MDERDLRQLSADRIRRRADWQTLDTAFIAEGLSDDIPASGWVEIANDFVARVKGRNAP